MQKRVWMTGVMLLVLIFAAGSVFAAESAHTKEEIVRAYMERVVPENAEEVSSAVQVTVKEREKKPLMRQKRRRKHIRTAMRKTGKKITARCSFCS